MLLFGNYLVETLRSKCDNVKHRLWIATPFIGNNNDVLRVIGGKWRNAEVDFRVLTDVKSGFIRVDTFDDFVSTHSECVKSLESLHAKIFIVDDWCLLTSANLTGTAFSARYEFGTDEGNIKDVEDYFLSLWDNRESIVVSQVNHNSHKSQIDFEDGNSHFKKKWSLPKYSKELAKKDVYLAKCSVFKEFAKEYEQVTGRNTQMKNEGFTLLQEVDYFFNYLNHRLEVSKDLKEPIVRRNIDKLMLKYFKKMSEEYDSNEPDTKRRIRNTRLVDKLTSPSRIMTLTRNEVMQVLDVFNCMGNNIHGHKTALLKNNRLKVILVNWDMLLNHGEITSTKVIKCQNSLKNFGESCVSELIAWRFPDQYPIINSCSKKGLWFFGKKV